MRVLKTFMIFMASSLMLACAHYEAKDHANVCYSRQSQYFEFETPPDGNQGTSITTFRLHPEISNEDRPIDASRFSIRLTGFTQGRKALREGHWTRGTDGIPMLYSTEDAYVEKEDGTRIHAERTIRIGSKKDPDEPGEALKESLVDLNSDEIQFSSKRILSNYGSIYIVFDTPPPFPTSRWSIHLGNIKLGTRTVAIPEQQLCVVKGFSFTKWGGLP